jgi:hypothetical protein
MMKFPIYGKQKFMFQTSNQMGISDSTDLNQQTWGYQQTWGLNYLFSVVGFRDGHDGCVSCAPQLYMFVALF